MVQKTERNKQTGSEQTHEIPIFLYLKNHTKFLFAKAIIVFDFLFEGLFG
jgi:hypothetical protein